MENAIAVYTSELDHSAGGADPEILLQDRLKKGKECLDNLSLLGLIVKTGIAEAIATRLNRVKHDKTVVAETIENNVRSKIIQFRKAQAGQYEEYLQRIAQLAQRVEAGIAEDTPGKRALYDNLNHDAALALRIDETVKQVRPDGWRGIQSREQIIKRRAGHRATA